MRRIPGGAKRIVRAGVILAVYALVWILLDAISTDYAGTSRASPWYLSVTLTFYLIYTCGEAFAPAGILVEWLRAEVLGVIPPVTLPVLILFGVQQVLIYGGAASLLRRVLRVRIPFLDLRDVLLYIAVVTTATVTAALAGVLLVVYVGAVTWSEYFQQVVIFATGDAIGFLTLVPALSIFLTPLLAPELAPPLEPNERRIGLFERTALPCVLLACAILGYRWLAVGGGAPIYYFLFLPLVWMAARGGLRFAALGVAYADLSVVALDAWYRIPASLSLSYQSYIAASSLTALTLGAVVSQRWREQRIALERARIDNVTGLPNPQALDHWLAGARRDAPKSLTLLLIAIENIRWVSEGLQRASVDIFTRGVAERLSEVPLRQLYLAHVSDHEFGIVLEGDDRQSAALAAEKLRIACERPIQVGDVQIYPSICVGIAACASADDAASLVPHAAEALDEARHGGTQSIAFHVAGRKRSASISLASELHRALRDDEFEVYFQPIFRCLSDPDPVDPAAGSRVVAAEALLRWNHPERGLLAPGEFIDLLDSMSLAERAGNRVVEIVCERLAAWKTLGLDVAVYVNVFARQLLEPEFVGALRATMRTHGLEPTNIVIELTERMVARDEKDIIAAAERLRQVGIPVAIDDFGTGHSSFARLRDFPFDILKIDQSFVRGIESDTRSADVATALIALSRDLEAVSLAEGVESDEQLRFLLRGGCNLIQGYRLALPMPAAEFEVVALNSIPGRR